MVPDGEPPAEDGRMDSDGVGLTPDQLYYVVRRAVEDAILGVIGTLLLVGVAFVLVWFGSTVATSAYETSPLTALGGLFVVAVGFYLAGSTLGVIPSVSDVV